MTRKRFIKILMACGIKRNRAVEIAAYANRERISYGAPFIAVIGAICELAKESKGGAGNEP